MGPVQTRPNWAEGSSQDGHDEWVGAGSGITIARCRELLGDVTLPDDQLAVLRDQLYEFAAVVIDVADAGKSHTDEPDSGSGDPRFKDPPLSGPAMEKDNVVSFPAQRPRQ